MKGSLVFMADLIRRIPLDLTVHLVRVTSQREQAAGRVLTEIVYSTSVPLEGKDVLLVDDIVDTGITLSYLLDHIHEHGPRACGSAPSWTSPTPARSTCTPTGPLFPVQRADGRPLPGRLRARLGWNASGACPSSGDPSRAALKPARA